MSLFVLNGFPSVTLGGGVPVPDVHCSRWCVMARSTWPIDSGFRRIVADTPGSPANGSNGTRFVGLCAAPAIS